MHFALRLFRQTFESVVRKRVVPPLPANLPAELCRPESGVYVAVFENPGRKPRGRVGSTLPTKSTLAEEIQHQAFTLATTFPFRKVDLPYLAYELLLTKAPQFLADLQELPPAAGLLLRTSRGRQGVSLPTSRLRPPAERLRDAVRDGGIDTHVADVRLYAFAIQVLREDAS